MTPEDESELQDLLKAFLRSKRTAYTERERYVVLKRYGANWFTSFSEFGDARSYARGLIDGASADSRGPAFVLDTDPEFARAWQVPPGDIESFVDLRREIKLLYVGVVDGAEYADKLIEERERNRLRGMKYEKDEREGRNLLIAMGVGGAFILWLLFG